MIHPLPLPPPPASPIPGPSSLFRPFFSPLLPCAFTLINKVSWSVCVCGCVGGWEHGLCYPWARVLVLSSLSLTFLVGPPFLLTLSRLSSTPPNIMLLVLVSLSRLSVAILAQAMSTLRGDGAADVPTHQGHLNRHLLVARNSSSYS